MTIGFDRPSGAAADVKELEYIVALHQTCFPLRKDGSITGKASNNIHPKCSVFQEVRPIHV
jgi:hypothetical protein